MTEQEAMQRALQLALEGWGRVWPNPLVGALLLRNERVIGEGYHAEFGGPHAEVTALLSCDDPQGSTCIVTLEPCAHAGKTPACTTALLEAGVRRVVAAVADPNPVAARGAERLRAAGVDVVFGVEAEAASAQNAAFFHAIHEPTRPFVALKLATSLDGYLADVQRRSQWISGEEARTYVHWLRAGFDAIGVGRLTACEDDPSLTVRGSVTPRITPRRVIFSRSGALPDHLELVRTAGEIPTLLVAGRRNVSAVEASLAGTRITVVPADSLAEALTSLRDLGVQSLLLEGGGAIASAFLANDLVDRLIWVQAPMLLRGGVPAFGADAGASIDTAPRWHPVERRTLGHDTLLVLDRRLCLQGS